MKISTYWVIALAAPSGFSQEPEFNQNLASDAEVSAPTTITPPEGCSTTDCHPGIKNHKHLHGPLHINACASCHQNTDVARHSFEFILPQQELCKSCHEMPHRDHGLVLHEPLDKGECLGCHDAHGSSEPRAILLENRNQLCLNCHFEITGGKTISHASADGGSCTTCHKSHSSPNPRLLTQPASELCVSCHVQTMEEVDTAHLAHAPVKDDCRLCHDPHAPHGTSMLKSTTSELCADCHQEVGQQMSTAAHPHVAMTKEKACLNCHFPHASDHGMLLRGPTLSLCENCHAQEIEQEDGRLMQAVPGDLSTAASVHGPVLRGECNLCHQVHGSGLDRLLKHQHSQTYAEFDASKDYALCFSCHDRQLILAERTSAVTEFRNGDVNLHFVHVNRPKSRSCNICHDPHAAQSNHLLRSAFPFGPSGWDLRIDWQQTQEGGTCSAGCHQAFEYNRVDAVEFVPENTDGKVPFPTSSPSKS